MKQIVSASRRTDIPSFFPDWFFSRLEAGFVDVANPFNPRQVRRVLLDPESVACFVFWTRDARPMLPRIGLLSDYPYYFHATLNRYGPLLEPGGPEIGEALESITVLAREVGPQRVIWRYDPVILAGPFDADWHEHTFRYLASRLVGMVRHVVVSVYDSYRHSDARLRRHGLEPGPEADPRLPALVRSLAESADKYGIPLSLCAEPDLAALTGLAIDFMPACIDAAIIEQIAGSTETPFEHVRDNHQRPGCRCTKSVDIGTYGTCPRGCLYCYASRARRQSI